MEDKPVQGTTGFGSVIGVVFGISACATLFVTLIVRLLFRRRKRATEP
jgi:hypothetical protein